MPGYIKKDWLKFQHQMPTESVDSPHKHKKTTRTDQHIKTIIRRRSQRSSKHCRNINLLFTLCLLYTSRRAQQNFIRTGKWNRRNKGRMSPNTWLRCVSWKCGNMIHCKWHDSCSTLRRILPIRKKARSWAGGHFYLTNQDDKKFNNEAVLTISSIIKHIMSSA